ncbi:MAG TPA: hypothetical protein DCE42_29425 [Myxococcales bacterium]|nr:hypothetical protein [Deltaproteobacteria bacterium]MBU47372.1 hypothetical protein [Deltaproteobacteria bacterium]HAA58914.1 hypothetical protein [Myxococcales bacterium]
MATPALVISVRNVPVGHLKAFMLPGAPLGPAGPVAPLGPTGPAGPVGPCNPCVGPFQVPVVSIIVLPLTLSSEMLREVLFGRLCATIAKGKLVTFTRGFISGSLSTFMPT